MLYKNLTAALCALCCSMISLAQPAIDWQRSFGGDAYDRPWVVHRLNNGSVIVAGETSSANGDVVGSHGYTEAWIVKVDVEGALEWQRCFGGSGDEVAQCIRQTSDGGYIFCGYTTSVDGDATELNGPMDIWVVKLDGTGELEWQRSYGGSMGERGWAIEELPNGEFYILAETGSMDDPMADSHGPRDLWLARITANGDLLWSRCYGGSFDDSGRDMAVLEDGSAILIGITRSPDGDVVGIHGQGSFINPDAWILKVDPLGDIVWQRCLGGEDFDTGWGVTVAPSGKIYAACTASSVDGDVSEPHGEWDYWIARLSAEGALELERSFGGSSGDQVAAIASTANNEVIVTGSSPSIDGDITAPRGGSDAWTLKLDQDLNLIWELSFGGSMAETGRDIHWSEDGVITLVASCASSDGDVTSNNGNADFWVVKLQPDDVGMGETTALAGFSVFPNPANDNIRIAWPDLDIRSVEVYDARGRKVATEAVGQRGLRQVDMDVSTWSDGLYTVSIQGAVGLLSKRFVKQ